MVKKFNISHWAVEHESFTRFLILVITVMGLFSLFKIGQQEDPSFIFRFSVAEVVWPGATATEVEQQVIAPFEKHLQDIPWLRYIESEAYQGRAHFMFYIRGDAPAEEVPRIWKRIQKTLDDSWPLMPDGVQKPVFNDQYGDTMVMLYALTGEQYNTTQLAHLGKKIRQEFLRVHGVQKVHLMGEIPEQITMTVPQRTLRDTRLSLLSLKQLLHDHSRMAESGSIPGQHLFWTLHTRGKIYSLSDLKKLPVVRSGHITYLDDLAQIVREPHPFFEQAVFFENKPAVLLGIVMTKGAHILTLHQELIQKTQLIQKKMPLGTHLQLISNQETSVRQYIQTFLIKLSFAVLIILGTTVFSLGIRTGLTVALSIPLVLAATFTAMYQWDIDFQKVSLGALIISLGLLVDDSVIVSEMIIRKREEGWDLLKAIGHSYETTSFPMLTGTLITIAGFIPVGLAQSTAGEYTFSLFVVVGVSLLFSWIVSVFLTPYISYMIFKNQKKPIPSVPSHNPLLKRCLLYCLAHPWTIITSTVLALLLSAIALVSWVPHQFFPSSNHNEIILDMWSGHNASSSGTLHNAQKIADWLSHNETLKTRIVHSTLYVGQGAPRFYLPLEQKNPSRDLAEFVILAKSIPDRDYLFSALNHLLEKNKAHIRFRLSLLNSGPPVSWPISFRILGPDRTVLKQITEQLKKTIAEEKNSHNVFDSAEDPLISVQFEPDLDKLASHNIRLQELQATLRYATEGLPIGELREGDKRIPIVIQNTHLHPIPSLQWLRSLLVRSETGQWIPLSNVGHWKWIEEEQKITHRNGLPSISVFAEVFDEEKTNSIASALNKKVDLIRKTLPLGYFIETGGSIEESRISQHSVVSRIPVLILITLSLLMMHLKSMKKTLLVYSTAPLGLIGCSLALLLTQKPFGFVSLLGLIALSGMIMRNSIILVDQIDQYTAKGVPLKKAIVDSTIQRFRPIVLTAEAAVFAFIPLSFNIFWGPMAIALIGGLIIATLLTLTFLPTLYAQCFCIDGEERS